MTTPWHNATERNTTAETAKRGTIPARQKLIVALLLGLLLAFANFAFAFADTGIPILDEILALIDEYKLGIAIIGIVIIGLGLLAKPLAPEFSANNRSYIVGMVVGGILITLAPTLAAAIVG